VPGHSVPRRGGAGREGRATGSEDCRQTVSSALRTLGLSKEGRPRKSAGIAAQKGAKRGLALQSGGRYDSRLMNLSGKTFRVLLATAVVLATTGSGMAALACLCRGDLAEHDGCHDAACPQVSLLGHEDDTAACECELGPVTGTHPVHMESRKSRFSVGTRCLPSICSVSWFSPSHLGTLGATPGVVPRTEAQLLALRTVVLRL